MSQTVASKAFVAFVAAAMVFSLVAPAAKAATADELQAQIATLMAQIEALKGTTTTTTTTTATAGACVAIPAPLTLGAKGVNVTALQNALIAAKQSIPAGATGYFGAQTVSALAAWQTANGVAPAVGYYGPITAAKMAAACATTPTTPTGTSTTPTTPSDLSGEADLDAYTADDADDDTVEEGSEEQEVAMFTAEFTDGDASISRLDVAFTKAVGDAWDTFDTVSLWVDGDMVAEASASDEDDYLGDEDDGIIRFSGLDIVSMEDEEVELVVKATMQDNLDTNELGSWTVTTESIRFFDADDVATTDTDLVDTESASFTIEVAGADDEVLVKTSANDPDATTLQVEDDAKSDDFHVFSFDLDTDDSTNDIELNELALTVTVSSSSYNTLVDDAELVIDGVTIDDVDVTNGTGTTATLTFNVDGDVVIDAGERVEAKLMLTFKSLASGNEGATVMAAIVGNSTNIKAEGSDDVTMLSGAATGEAHTLRTQGINGALKTVSSAVTAQDLATNDYATYKVSVDVTAFEQDVFISTNPASSSVYSLVDGAGATATTGSRSVTLTSTGDENGGYFEINEGETETITLTVTYTPGVANTAARLVLGSIIFNDAASMVTPQTWTASPATTYRTDVVTVVN
jgi:hypothetical protein